MNISKPDINSNAYRKYLGLVNQKVSEIMAWLTLRKIEYINNNWINGHLYRLYIPSKDLLLDFEYYPVNNYEYNYIRINYDTDVTVLMERLFPNVILDTQELDVWKLNQRAANKFLKENEASPVYGNDVLRIALVRDMTIFQCIILKDNKIITNVTKRSCSVPYGTYILLRYLNEMFGIQEIQIRECMDNSYTNTLYQVLNLPVISQTTKKKVWWSPAGAKWHIKTEDTDKYIPFYYCEYRTYKYPNL